MKNSTQSPGATIKAASVIHDIDIDQYFVEVEFQDVAGETQRIELPRSLISSGGKAFQYLLDKGANLPLGRHMRKELAGILGERAPVKRVTRRAGWHGRSFVLPDKTIGPDAETLSFRGSEAAIVDQYIGGSLKRWKEKLRKPCLRSSYLTFGIGMSFAGPLLKLVGQDEGVSFYLAGGSSTGKTLVELACQSVIMRAVRTELLSHDATHRAFEEAAAGHNDLSLVIDELDRCSGSNSDIRRHIRELGHMLAGGTGRRRSARATQDRSLADLGWRILSLWSGECRLDSCFLGEQRRRGEMVRLIEIPVPKRKAGGIFDRMTKANADPWKLAQAAEKAIASNFGTPIRCFIARLVKDPDAIRLRVIELRDEFVKRVGAERDAWLRRLATKFGIVYAAARIAAEMDIAPWPKNHPFRCVARLYRRARNVVATPREALDDLLLRLGTNATNKSRFPAVKKGQALPPTAKRTAWGFRRHSPGKPAYLAVLSSKLDTLVRPRKHAGQVRQLLASRGYALQGKEGRMVTQLMVKGFGPQKPYFVRIDSNKLPKSRSGN